MAASLIPSPRVVQRLTRQLNHQIALFLVGGIAVRCGPGRVEPVRDRTAKSLLTTGKQWS